jgi:hypothetical protein
MSSVAERLERIVSLNANVQVSAAEEEARALIEELDVVQLGEQARAIDAALQSFLKKRYKVLKTLLDEKLAGAARQASSEGAGHAEVRAPAGRGFRAEDDLEATLVERFAELSERHIFQWSTFYRDFLGPLFPQIVSLLDESTDRVGLARRIRAQFAAHANEIFVKGHDHVTRKGGGAAATTKSLAGLQRFLELPIEFYSAFAMSMASKRNAFALRTACSAMLAGILDGYGDARFGDQRGWQLLPRYPRSWTHYVGFLSAGDLGAAIASLEPGNIRDGIAESVAPVASALDALIAEHPDEYSALPSLGQFDWNERRLDISLHRASRGGGTKQLEIQCYLDIGYTNASRLEEAANRGVALIVAPLRPDVQELIEAHDTLRGTVVNSLPRAAATEAAGSRALKILRYAISRCAEASSAWTPLEYNFARDFPLHNPFLSRYFHVYRASVRSLLMNFEKRNGVRLWCSVRRSGKTTACFDLGTTSGHSMVISQTCDGTHQREESDLFYRLVTEALDSGRQIPANFFLDAVERCSPGRRPSDSRYVFVLDEYETLFERLQLRVRRDKEVRYALAQPLLNQMVAFSRENLLVFMGQRPDAHFIIMEQNQLSAYVEQDSFPLFTNESGRSEFRELLRKVLTDRVDIDDQFVAEVFRETAGHPFLTVKVLVHMFDWLIEQKRSVHDLRLTGADFQEFTAKRLTTTAIGTSKEYDFFREAINEAVDEHGKRDAPWLHSIYSVMQRLALNHPEELRCTRAEFAAIVDELRVAEYTGSSTEDLLRTGAQANFLSFDDQFVQPKIRLLARVSLAARRSVRW